eukprot:jgi/Botrbrau1/4654/Bobra.33_2s0025.1
MNAPQPDKVSVDYYSVLNVPRDAADEEIKRAYRQLASVSHPDKVQDPNLRTLASSNFMLVQEAYEVLSDERKREVYDIYGKEGLEAGLEVELRSRMRQDIKSEWERFLKVQAGDANEDTVVHNGMHMFRFDASALLDPYDTRVSRVPDLTGCASSNLLEVSLDALTAAFFQAQVVMQRAGGGGAFVAGLKRDLFPDISLQGQVELGLKNSLACVSRCQLTQFSAATLSSSWSPRSGLGMQVSTSRVLNLQWKGEVTCVVGPLLASGWALELVRETTRVKLVLRLDLGAVTGISARATWIVRADTRLRVSGRVTTSGIDAEVGVHRRVSQHVTAYLGVQTTLNGIVLKPRVSRGGHTFEFPLLLSHDTRDVRVLLAAHLLPPLATLLIHTFVVRPLWRRHRANTILQKRSEAVKTAEDERRKAEGTAKLLQPMIRRKQDSAAAKSPDGAFVVGAAVYGPVDALSEGCRALGIDLPDEATQVSEQLLKARGQAAGPAAGGRRGGDDLEGEDEVVRELVARRAAGEAGAPPRWLDVTVATQFMSSDDRLAFYEGGSKSGLMGFCDPAPGEQKLLRILYRWKGEWFLITLSDKEGATLPVPTKGVKLDAATSAALDRRLSGEGCTPCAAGDASDTSTQPRAQEPDVDRRADMLRSGSRPSRGWVDSPVYEDGPREEEPGDNQN